MRERVCRVVPLGPVLLVRIVERDYGGADWRLVEEFDVTSDIARLVAASEETPARPLPEASTLAPERRGEGEAVGVGRNGQRDE